MRRGHHRTASPRQASPTWLVLFGAGVLLSLIALLIASRPADRVESPHVDPARGGRSLADSRPSQARPELAGVSGEPAREQLAPGDVRSWSPDPIEFDPDEAPPPTGRGPAEPFDPANPPPPPKPFLQPPTTPATPIIDSPMTRSIAEGG
jgi:hypothetical protein